MIKKLLIGFLALAVLGGVINAVVNKDKPPKEKTPEQVEADRRANVAMMAAKELRGMQKDPSSFALSQALLMPDGAVCFEYRSRNSFNALVVGNAVFDGQRLVTSATAEHTKLWNTRCAGKTGEDITSAAKFML